MQTKADQNNILNNINDNNFQQYKPEIEQIYKCSCGKHYKSFPAIYLHFRTKHDIKLSTKPTEKRINVLIDNGIKYIVYNVDQQSQNNQQITSDLEKQQKNIKYSIQAFQIKNIQEVLFRYKLVNDVSEEFPALQLLQFLKQKQDSKQHKKIQIKLQYLPYFINDFVIQYLPKCIKHIKIGTQNWKQYCRQINKFCNWLHKQNYTDLIVIYEVK